MRAIVQTRSGGPDTLRLAELERPILQEGQLLVKVCAASINRADIVQREGHYPAPPGASPILGLDIAGWVEDVRGLSRFRIGDPVFGLVPGGGYAEFAVLDSAVAIPKPDYLSWVEAASLPEAWMASWLMLIELGRLKEGETALIHAGASGVGTAAIQLVRLWGGRALASVGSQQKVAFCQDLGAECAYLRQDHPNFSELVRHYGGADLVLDPVGGSYLAENLRCLKLDGRLILIGIMGGKNTDISLGSVLMKRLSLFGCTLRNQPLAVKTKLANALETHILPAIKAGMVRTVVDSVFPLEHVAAAHSYLETNGSLGKVVLSTGEC